MATCQFITKEDIYFKILEYFKIKFIKLIILSNLTIQLLQVFNLHRVRPPGNFCCTWARIPSGFEARNLYLLFFFLLLSKSGKTKINKNFYIYYFKINEGFPRDSTVF